MSFGRNSRALNKQPLSNAGDSGIRTEELQYRVILLFWIQWMSDGETY